MRLSSRIGEARKQIGIVEEAIGEDEEAARVLLDGADFRLEAVEEALEEADL